MKNGQAISATKVDLAHSACFALVGFLTQINIPIDQIVGLANASPVFDQEKTHDQVEHITGASGTKYKSPFCATWPPTDTALARTSCSGELSIR